MRGATRNCKGYRNGYTISTHTPLAGCNKLSVTQRLLHGYFYSHTPCGVQPLSCAKACHICCISTHTPLAGCNVVCVWGYCKFKNFYSHTPCGVQLNVLVVNFFIESFLLTHPLRGATNYTGCLRFSTAFLLTHPLRGATCAVISGIMMI